MCNKHADNNIKRGDLNGLTFLWVGCVTALYLKMTEVRLQLSPYNVFALEQLYFTSLNILLGYLLYFKPAQFLPRKCVFSNREIPFSMQPPFKEKMKPLKC